MLRHRSVKTLFATYGSEPEAAVYSQTHKHWGVIETNTRATKKVNQHAYIEMDGLTYAMRIEEIDTAG